MLLRDAARLAASAAGNNRARDYAAAMNVIVASAKLDLEHAKIERLLNMVGQSSAPEEVAQSSVEERRARLLALTGQLKQRALAAPKNGSSSASNVRPHPGG